VNGDFDIKPGNLVNINMPTPEMKNISETRFAGRWMVYKNEHVITSQKHSMILYLMRDGNYHDPDYQYSINTSKRG
jgi:broad specificity polyphosphatase/5'/3'-nucleotidase SurE